VDERNRHAAFAHPAGDPLDRPITNVTRAKYAGKTRFQRKRLAIEGPRSQIPSGTNVALVVALQGVDGILIRAITLKRSQPDRVGSPAHACDMFNFLGASTG
jgi:hypothetical protein